MSIIFKYILAILVAVVLLECLHHGFRMSHNEQNYKHSKSAEPAQHRYIESEDKKKDVRVTESDLDEEVRKLELKFKDNPYKERCQLYVKTLRHLTKARQNKTIWRQLDLMKLPPYDLDPEYRNPCWWSSSTPTYTCISQFKLWRSIISEKKIRYSESHFHCLPYFYIIGQAKSGTTDMFVKIQQHPDVATRVKEPEWIHRKRIQPYDACSSIDAYTSMFQVAADDILHHHKPGTINPYVASDATPGYFSDHIFWDLLPGNEGCKEPCVTNADIIHHITPGAKLILSLRNPTDRRNTPPFQLWNCLERSSFPELSSWNFWKERSFQTFQELERRLLSFYFFKRNYFGLRAASMEEFHHLVLVAIEKFQKCLESQTLRGCSYNYTLSDDYTQELDLQRGVYHVFLSDWLKVFPRDQIHIIRFEDYAADETKHLRGIFQFLKFRELSQEELRKINRKGWRNCRPKADHQIGDMWNSTRNILNTFYKPFNERLSALLKSDKFLW